jgi:O-antigen/teichoic acid export membrane protein
MTALSRTARSPFTALSLNSLLLLAARVAGQALAFFFTLAVARSLGEAGFGQFAFITAVVFVGNVATTFGLDTLLIRDVAAARAGLIGRLPEAMGAALFLQLALSAGFIIVLWFIGPQLPNQTAVTIPALRLASLSLVPLAFSTVYSAILRGHELMGDYLWFTIAMAAASGLGGLWLWLRGGSLTGAAGIILFAQLIGAATAYALCRRALVEGHRRWAWPSRAVLGRAARVGAVLATLMVLAVGYQRLGVFVLSARAGDAATGWYGAAGRVLEGFKLIPGAFFGALLPMMIAGREPGTRHAYRLSFAALLALSGTLAVAGVFLARPTILFLFGPDYEPAIPALRLMLVSLPLTVVTFKLSFDLVVSGKERLATISMALTLLSSAVVTIWLVDRAALYGAAVALIVSESIQVVILLCLTLADRQLNPTAIDRGEHPAVMG